MNARRARLGRVRLVAGTVLIASSGGLAAWAGFVVARGVPGECGGDATPCPPGSASAFLSLMLAVFVALPLGAWLAAGRGRHEAYPLAVALPFAGIAAGVLTSRFVAYPITTSTATTWWTAGISGGIAAIALVVALALAGSAERPGPARDDGPAG